MTHRGTNPRCKIAARLAAAALPLVIAAIAGSSAPNVVIAEDTGATPVMTDSMARAIESGTPPAAQAPAPAGDAAQTSGDMAAPVGDAAPPPPVESAPPSREPVRPAVEGTPGGFLAEVIDSTYFIEPAEFFALDLPVHSRGGGATAVHMLGDVSVVGGRHDIVVRLFRSGDYQNWLKRRGGRQAGPVWSSPRLRNVHLDQELPQGTPLVLLLDNGYSLRTPKRVRVQVQLRYQGEPGAQNVSVQPPPAPPQEGDVTPRSNSDEEFPPPPPPPPSSDDGK